MNNEASAYAEMTVHFGSDTALMTFPYLGQTTFMGNIEALLAGSKVKPPRMFIPLCASPEVRQYMDQALEDGRLADAASKPIPSDLKGMEFDTLAGLRMCGQIQHDLQTPKAEKAGLTSIAKELVEETDSLIMLLAAAGGRGLQFHFNLQECDNPPAPLVAWVAAENMDTRKWMAELMDQVEEESAGKA